jgi:hypothetical protein
VTILIECARPSPDAARLRRAAEGVADWTAALRQADRHGLVPLLHWRLSRLCPDAVPAAAASQLAASFHANAGRGLVMAAELRTVLRWLSEAGVDALAFKGPTLAALAYENLALREFGDLDILVRPRDRSAALSALAARGCVPKGAPGAADLAGNCEAALTTPGGCEIDLHWSLSPPFFLPLDERGVFERKQAVVVAGAALPTLGPDDLFAALALHGARHCWASLGWVCDVAGLARVAPPDWDRLLGDRRRRRVYLLAALLAADMLDAPVPDSVVDAARRDGNVAAVATQLRGAILHGPAVAAGSVPEALVHLRLMTMARDRARYVWRRALQPNQIDNDFLPLSGRWRPLLWLVRPLRIVSKLFLRG